MAKTDNKQESESEEKKFNLTVKNKKLIIFISALLVLMGILYLGKSLFVVAIINNRPIFRTSIISELEKRYGSATLESVVNESLILQEASKKNVVVSTEAIDKEVKIIEDNIKAQGSDLDTELSRAGQKREDLLKGIKLKLLIEKILADRIQVSDKEIEDYFNSNKTVLYKDQKIEDVKDSVKATLMGMKLEEEYLKWIEEIKNSAKIKYFLSY